MIDKLKEDLARAEASRKRLDLLFDPNVESSGLKYQLERRFFDGYITAIKYALVLAIEESRDKALNPFSKEVE